MRTGLLTAIAVAAGLTQVAAVPLRVVVVTSTTGQDVSVPSNIRIGHVGHNPAVMMAGTGAPRRRPCGGRMSQFRQTFHDKAIEMSNAFRQALGMPLIETGKEDKMYKIMPFIGTPPTFVEVEGSRNGNGQVDGKTRGGDTIRILPAGALPPPQFDGHHHHHHGHHGGHHHSHAQHHGGHHNFIERLETALLALGPWEGRAVAFVLGCGLGVLLRMLWVLTVITYRSIKGERDNEPEYAQITVIEEYDEEPQEVLFPPPNYTFNDEKVPVANDAPAQK